MRNRKVCAKTAVLAILFLFAFSALCGAATLFIGSAYIGANSDDGLANFDMGTSSSYTPADAILSFHYAGPGFAPSSTTHFVVNVDGVPTDANSLGAVITTPFYTTSGGTEIIGVQKFSGVVEVTTDMKIVNNPSTGLLPDTLEFKFTAKNTDTLPHCVALRFELDTMVMWNDGTNISADNGFTVYTANTLYSKSLGNIPQNLWDYDVDPHVGTPSLVGRIHVYNNPFGDAATQPDFFEVGDWNVANTAAQWTFIPPGAITNDSCVVLWWTGGNSIWSCYTLAPGASMTFITYYGLNQGTLLTTPTNTPTPTPGGLTNTPTSTPTRTNTTTNTQTNTSTNTPTPLVSNTPTNTYTVTNTPTVTNTRTNTNTPTNTMTPTSTRTPTNTYTATNTPTVTNTFTITNTRTNTPTYTETRTPTDTPTITPTMPVVPFVIKLGLYNEAGELVGYIGTVGSEKSCTGIDMLLAGKSANTVLSGSNVTISLAGTQVPGGAAGDMDALSWHVDSAAAQEIATGAYIIKAEQKDMYDHVIVVTKSITIIKSEEYVEMKIFNSAGELVNTYRQYVSVDDKFLSAMSLETKSSYIVGANKKAEVGYASGMYFEWDGRNAHGILVESGVYEIQITGKTASGQSMVASKTVTVISENTEKLFEEASSYPNPVKVNETVNFVWHSLSTGRMTVRIYNISGEKIATVAGMINSGKITWNGKTSHGDTAATGVYVCMLEAISDDGRIYREKVKIAVAGKGNDGK